MNLLCTEFSDGRKKYMALHFILGGSGRGKSYYLNHRIAELAAKEPGQQFVMLVPEQFTMQTQREMVRISPGGGIMNIDVQSFVRLAYRIFGETGAGSLPVLDDMGKTMILRKVLADRQEQLQYFGANIRKKGYVAEIKSFLSELLQYGMGSEQIGDMIEGAAGHAVLQRKLQDMQVAYDAFMDYLKENYITSEEVLSVLCDVVSESEILRDAVVTLDGFTGFTPIQYRLIEQLLICCREVYVTVTIDAGEELLRVGPKHRLFYMSRNMMHHLRELAEKNHIEVCPEIWTGQEIGQTRFAQAPGLAYLEQTLFRFPVRAYQGVPEDLSIHVLRQPEQEVSFVLEQILALRQQGERYRDIAVVTGDMEVYGTIAAQAFEKAGIPCFIDQKKSILTHPVVEMLRSLTDVLLSDMAYEQVIRFLRGRYSPLSGAEIDLLDNFLLVTGIRGQKKWKEPWSCGYAFSLRDEEKVQAMDERMNGIRERVWTALGTIYGETAKGKHTVHAYAAGFVRFLEEQKIYRRIQKDIERFQEQGDSERVREYGQIYEIILGVFDRLVELLGTEEMTLREFRELLDTGFSEARVGLIPPGVDQVVVGDISRTRLSKVRHLFFLGVNDCNIPKGAGGGGILSDAERDFLQTQDFTLAPTAREEVYTEQFYLYLNLTKPQKHLYLCYCETGNDGVAQNPSYLIDRVRKIFPQLEVSVEEVRQDTEHILGDDQGISYLIRGLQRSRFLDTRWQEIYRYYWSEPQRQAQIRPLVEAAFYRDGHSMLSKEAAKALYETVLNGSTSQLEKYASCAYSYFLQYGLHLNQRAEHAVEFFDIGNIVHEALELYTKQLLEEQIRWQDLSEEQQHVRANQCLNAVVEEYKNGLLYDTHRDTYMITRLRRILQRTVWAITSQMQAGDFATVQSELAFKQIQGPMNLLGRVDRVDLLEQDTAEYVTIIDYKTGRKDLSLSDLYFGLQMQLIIYLDAAVERREYSQKERKMVIPAGVFYYNIEDPMLEGAVPEEQREQAILKELRLRGLVNEDDPVLPSVDHRFKTESGELPLSAVSLVAPFETDKNGALKKKSSAITTKDFRQLMQYTKKKIQTMSQQILDGHIEMNPYRRMDASGMTGCSYCPYHSVCQFDVRFPGHAYRSIPKLSDDDVFRKINEEQE